MEKSDTLFNEDYSQLLSSLVYRGIIDTTPRGSNKLCSRSGSTEDVIDEWELEQSALALEMLRGTIDDFSHTKASLETATSPNFAIWSSFSFSVNSSGTSSKTASYISLSGPDFGSSPLTRRSIALLLSGLLVPFFHFMPNTLSWKRSHQISALDPANRVQWILDCCPAPRPMTCPFNA